MCRLIALLLAVFSLWNLAPASAQDQEPAGEIAGHPALARAPRVTATHEGRPGDAVNVAFIGTDEELHRVLATAGWYAADPITCLLYTSDAADE